jgi:hypothetical protein|tara:strand:- start:1589 stop:2104 length:516 start_codon:yes stop_codon:yes gene_type:complete
MGMNARMSEGDRRLYNPSRDVAHNFQEVMNLVAGRLEDQKWPELQEILKRESVTMDQLGEACGAYCAYLASAADKDKQDRSMTQSVKDSGFFDCEPAAQVAVLAMIGTCYAGIQFGGIRECSVGGEGPMETISDLLKHVEEFRKFQGMSRFRRKWVSFKLKLSAVFAAWRS